MKKIMISLLTAITIVGICVPAFAEDISDDKFEIQILNEPMLISTNTAKDVVNNVIIHGKTINLRELGVVINNGKVMVPLKVTAEGLGFKVDINKDNKKAELDNDKIKTEIEVDKDSYYYASSHMIGMTAPEKLGAAPVVIDNEIYVPINLYKLLLNDSKTIGSCFVQTKDGQGIYVENGELTTGWKLINNKWYFMNNDGIMQKGWVQSNNNWYYLYDNGEMASDTITPDGYKVDQSGKWDFGKAILNSTEKNKIKAGMQNPIEEYKTIAEAQKALKFKVSVPKEIPSEYKVKFISTISKETFQIGYGNEKNQILFRMGQGVENISGDYNIYKVNNTIKLEDKSINLSGNDKLINLATWKIDNMYYSLSVDNGMEKDDIIKIIKSTF
ncbi:stalk domain-containing protein [Clostridium sp. C2-6-12]|uniref:stalk domain-containing protein n=1 Tax=Clostridium sp. C2-6-12 TaxID=2698832 RepID=UPI001370273A|nr:stalk domain-containing protein [Clostridium sp. C2-6-12]